MYLVRCDFCQRELDCGYELKRRKSFLETLGLKAKVIISVFTKVPDKQKLPLTKLFTCFGCKELLLEYMKTYPNTPREIRTMYIPPAEQDRPEIIPTPRGYTAARQPRMGRIIENTFFDNTATGVAAATHPAPVFAFPDDTEDIGGR